VGLGQPITSTFITISKALHSPNSARSDLFIETSTKKQSTLSSSGGEGWGEEANRDDSSYKRNHQHENNYLSAAHLKFRARRQIDKNPLDSHIFNMTAPSPNDSRFLRSTSGQTDCSTTLYEEIRAIIDPQLCSEQIANYWLARLE